MALGFTSRSIIIRRLTLSFSYTSSRPPFADLVSLQPNTRQHLTVFSQEDGSNGSGSMSKREGIYISILYRLYFHSLSWRRIRRDLRL